MQDIISLKQIPQELKFNALWCGWKYGPTGKIPYNVRTDKYAKANDETTFVSYGVLLQHAHKYILNDSDGKLLGGIGLGIFRGYSAIDIDHCVDEHGNINEMASDIIKYCNSYTEYSPSNTGIRIIFKTQNKIDPDMYYINNHKLGLEVYISDNTNKFVTITGNKISGDEINEIDISYVLNKYMKKTVSNVTKTVKKSNPDINLILERDSKLRELWNDTNHELVNGTSQESNKDEALCCKLAYYYDEENVLKYFKQSQYYLTKDEKHKKKWERKDYVASTVNNAVTYVGEKQQNNYDLTDTGNAHRFIDKFGQDLRYNVDNKLWMIWNGNYWQYDLAEQVKNFIEILSEEMLQDVYSVHDTSIQARMFRNIEHINSSSGKEALLKEARHLAGVPVFNSDFDSNPYIFCFKNGVLDLKTGELRESRKSDMISQVAGTEIAFGEQPKILLKLLHDMWPTEPEKINFLHKWFGYCLTDDACEQKLLILQSDGNSGKSLLLDIINEVMGSYGITSDSDLITDLTYKSSNSEQIARLKGKRFVFIDEIDENASLKEKLVKGLTSGIGKMTGRYLYANTTEFPFKGKINIATNYEPKIRGNDRGVWRRILRINTKLDVTGKENKHLRDELLLEKPQIANWLYEGYKLYLQEGLELPDSIKQEISEYRKEQDTVSQWVEECCEVDDNYFEKAGTLFDNYKLYMMKRDLKTNMTAFGRNMGKKFEKKHYSSGYVYLGIRLKQGVENIAKKVLFDKVKVDENI